MEILAKRRSLYSRRLKSHTILTLRWMNEYQLTLDVTLVSCEFSPFKRTGWSIIRRSPYLVSVEICIHIPGSPRIPPGLGHRVPPVSGALSAPRTYFLFHPFFSLHLHFFFPPSSCASEKRQLWSLGAVPWIGASGYLSQEDPRCESGILLSTAGALNMRFSEKQRPLPGRLLKLVGILFSEFLFRGWFSGPDPEKKKIA